MQTRIEVGILGATGMVGQHFIRFLQGHPWFDLKWLGASDRSAGKLYKDAMVWHSAGLVPDSVKELTVEESKPGNAPRLLFSAMDASVATEIERAFAQAGHVVVSNSRNHRMEQDVPLLVPEVNSDHLSLLEVQRSNRGWKGGIVTNANCASIMAVMALAPLHEAFGVRRLFVATMQAVSGAGYPGVPSLDILGNVIPFIGGEEGKIESEIQKMLGRRMETHIEHAPITISAHANRVSVENGHTVCLSVDFENHVDAGAALEVLRDWQGDECARGLPSSPERPLAVTDAPDRPQPRRDVDLGRGMTVTVGRVREDPLFDVKLVAMGHNTVRGAAGASVLNAELLVSTGQAGLA